MEFLQTLRTGDVLAFDNERWLVARAWNGRTVQVRQWAHKQHITLRPGTDIHKNRLPDVIDVFVRNYGYKGKYIDDITKEPFNIRNQWLWDYGSFQLTPTQAYDTSVASEQNAPSPSQESQHQPESPLPSSCA